MRYLVQTTITDIDSDTTKESFSYECDDYCRTQTATGLTFTTEPQRHNDGGVGLGDLLNMGRTLFRAAAERQSQAVADGEQKPTGCCGE